MLFKIVIMLRLLFCLLFFSSLISTHSFADTAAGVKLRVITENWRPYSYEENGEVRGKSTEIVKKVLERAGIDYSISVHPWSRSYLIAKTEPNVLIYSLVRIPVREKLFKWVRPLGAGDTSSLYRLKNNTDNMPTTIEEAKKFLIVTNANSMDHLWLTDKGFLKLVTPRSLEKTVQAFLKGRAPLMAFDDNSITAELSELTGVRDNLVKVLPLFNAPPFFALSISTDDAIKLKLQKAYDELLAEGAIDLVN